MFHGKKKPFWAVRFACQRLAETRFLFFSCHLPVCHQALWMGKSGCGLLFLLYENTCVSQKPKVGTFWQAHRPLIFQQIFKSFHLEKFGPRCSPLCWWKKHVFPIFFKSFWYPKPIRTVVPLPNMGSSSWVPMATTVISGVSTVTVIPDHPGNYSLKSPGIYPIKPVCVWHFIQVFCICGYLTGCFNLPSFILIFLAARSGA